MALAIFAASCGKIEAAQPTRPPLTHWTHVDRPLTGGHLRGLAFDTIGRAYSLTGLDVISRAGPGAPGWSPLSHGFGMVGSFAFGRSGAIYLAGASTMLRSDDAGQTWRHLTPPPRNAGRLAIADKGSIYLTGVDDKVYRSRDGGMSWVAVLSAPGLWMNPGSQLVAGRKWIVVTDGGALFSSQDDGETFVTSAMPGERLAGCDDVLYAGRSVSHDGGMTWQEMPFVIASGPVLTACDGPRVVALGRGSSELWSSQDQGATASVRSVPAAAGAELLAVHGNSVFLSLLHGGILRSEDGGKSFVRFDDARHSDAAVYAVNDPSVASASGDLYIRYDLARAVTRDQGATWADDPLSASMGTVRGAAGTMFFGTCRSDDGGKTCVNKNPAGRVCGYDVNLDARGHVLASCGDGVARSIDRGDSWTRPALGGVICLGLRRVDANRLYVNCDDDVWFSGDDGTTWRPVGAPSGAWVTVVDHRGRGLLARTSGGTLQFLNDGSLGDTIALPLPAEASVQAVAAAGANADVYVAFTDPTVAAPGPRRGVLGSADDGQTWVDVSAGIEGWNLNNFAWDATGVLYASTSDGLYRAAP